MVTVKANVMASTPALAQMSMTQAPARAVTTAAADRTAVLAGGFVFTGPQQGLHFDLFFVSFHTLLQLAAVCIQVNNFLPHAKAVTGGVNGLHMVPSASFLKYGMSITGE